MIELSMVKAATDLADKLWSFGTTIAKARSERRIAVAKLLDEVADTMEALKAAAGSGTERTVGLASQLQVHATYGEQLLADVLPLSEANAFGEGVSAIAQAGLSGRTYTIDEERSISTVIGRLRGLGQMLRAPPASQLAARWRHFRTRPLIATQGYPYILITPPEELFRVFSCFFAYLAAFGSFAGVWYFAGAIVGALIVSNWSARVAIRITIIAALSYGSSWVYHLVVR